MEHLSICNRYQLFIIKLLYLIKRVTSQTIYKKKKIEGPRRRVCVYIIPDAIEGPILAGETQLSGVLQMESIWTCSWSYLKDVCS